VEGALGEKNTSGERFHPIRGGRKELDRWINKGGDNDAWDRCGRGGGVVRGSSEPSRVRRIAHERESVGKQKGFNS